MPRRSLPVLAGVALVSGRDNTCYLESRGALLCCQACFLSRAPQLRERAKITQKICDMNVL